MLDIEEKTVLAPASLPQQAFLESTSTITLYHGSAGSGKTFAIVLNLVKFAARRNSTIAYFRRTSPELRAPGGVWQEATAIFKKMFPDCKIRSRDLEIYIPSTNSVVKFSSLQYISDVDKALGSQYSVVVYDEAVTFTPFEDFVLPLLGRLRNANVDYTPQMFWATNPRFDHGIYHWIKDFYLGDDGIPLDSKSNIERFFILRDNSPVWFESYDKAKEYCLKNYAGQKIEPRSFRAIKAHITQNVPLLKNNPDYLANLYALPEIKRRIYLDGSWTAREEEAGYFKREWCNFLPFPSLAKCKRVRAWDAASTPPSSANPDPDWTRGTLISKDNDGMYTIEDIRSLRDRPHVVEQTIYATARMDGPSVTQVLECDPGAAGVAYANQIKAKLAEQGFYCKIIRSQKTKLTRFLPVSALAEAGRLQFVKSEWTEEALKELENFTGEKRNGHDDICDTLSTGIAALNQGVELPTMVTPNISVSGIPAKSFHQSYGPSPGSFTLPSFNIK